MRTTTVLDHIIKHKETILNEEALRALSRTLLPLEAIIAYMALTDMNPNEVDPEKNLPSIITEVAEMYRGCYVDEDQFVKDMALGEFPELINPKGVVKYFSYDAYAMDLWENKRFVKVRLFEDSDTMYIFQLK